MSGLRVRRARPEELPICHALRHEVFVIGQGVPLQIDRDGLDGTALQLIAFDGDEPVGTARMRVQSDAAKAERVAVRATLRRSGIGRALMAELEREARAQGRGAVVLHAQQEVVAFYERLGYVAEGERFLEADIWHRAMRKSL